MANLIDPQTALDLRIAAALMFAVAAIGKLREPARFCTALANYRLLPQILLMPAAFVLPLAEIAVAITLPVGGFAPWPEAGAAALLLLFGGAIAVNLLRNRRDIACGCSFGSADKELRWALVLRNLLLAALIVCSAAAPAIGGWRVTFLAMAGGTALFALFAAVDAISALFAAHPVPTRTRRVS